MPNRSAKISAGRDELPGRHAGGARDHEFEAARQREIAGHRADQHAERHEALEHQRQAEEGNLRTAESEDAFGMSPMRRIISM